MFSLFLTPFSLVSQDEKHVLKHYRAKPLLYFGVDTQLYRTLAPCTFFRAGGRSYFVSMAQTYASNNFYTKRPFTRAVKKTMSIIVSFLEAYATFGCVAEELHLPWIRLGKTGWMSETTQVNKIINLPCICQAWALCPYTICHGHMWFNLFLPLAANPSIIHTFFCSWVNHMAKECVNQNIFNNHFGGSIPNIMFLLVQQTSFSMFWLLVHSSKLRQGRRFPFRITFWLNLLFWNSNIFIRANGQ